MDITLFRIIIYQAVDSNDIINTDFEFYNSIICVFIFASFCSLYVINFYIYW